MYQGNNIHYTTGADHKPLCSFSAKLCHQHRLNGYAFCVRHILEDPTAPFKRCAYVAKSSKQMCTQAIPQHEIREYCNNHMQVMGMLPKKEKKQKPPKIPDHSPLISSKDKLPFKDRVSRFNAPKNEAFSKEIGRFKLKSDILGGVTEDGDDPYAFPDPGGASTGPVNNLLPSSSPYHEPPLSVGSQGSHGSKSPGDGGASSIAKLYPELAEKLEKIKPSPTPHKTKEKGKSKSSRTLNRLQTKIAQNRIKDKLKRNQESNSQSQSPCHTYHSYNPGNSNSLSAVNHYDFIERTLPNSAAERNLPNTTAETVPSPGLQYSGLPKRSNLPLYVMPNHMGNSEINHNIESSGSAPHIPQGIPHGMPLELLPGMPNSVNKLPHNILNIDSTVLRLNYLSSLKQQPGSSTSLPLNPSVAQCTTTQQLPVPFQDENTLSNTPSSKTSNTLSDQENVQRKLHQIQQEVFSQQQTYSQEHEQLYNTIPSKQQPPPPPSVPPPPYTQSLTQTRTQSLSSTAVVTSDPVTTQSVPLDISVPPPPPYTSLPHRTTTKTKSLLQTSLSSSVISNLPSCVVTHPKKFKYDLDNKDLKKKFKVDAVQNFYYDHISKQERNRNLVSAGFSSGEESSDSETENLLSWQPDWFSPSSDEEMQEDEDTDDAIRTTKLALLRARLRRQCFQYRTSHKANYSQHRSNNSAAMALIHASRDGPQATVKVVKDILCQQEKIVNRFKKRGLQRRLCCHKNEKEESCQNAVLPYTNHCLSHIMYNVDQQLFEYCTAKFADNTQCCTPVFDIRHELPLCMEHAVKADNYSKDQDTDSKQKRSRKKTKPSALTRPPRKGKKKKNSRKPLRPQKPSPPSEPTGITGMPATISTVPQESVHTGSSSTESVPEQTPQPEESIKNTVSPITALPKPQSSPPVAAAVMDVQSNQPTRIEKTSLSDLPENMLTMVDNLNTDLPLEQASKLLEEPDFQDVFNKLPDEAFHLFSGKNGDFVPTNEEFEELERHLAAANMDVTNAQKTLENFDLDLDEEQLKQILFGSGTTSANLNSGSILCNGEDQESINAIARSLSASELLLPRTSVPFTGANMYPVLTSAGYGPSSVIPPQNKVTPMPPVLTSAGYVPGSVIPPQNKVAPMSQNPVIYSTNSQYSQYQTHSYVNGLSSHTFPQHSGVQNASLRQQVTSSVVSDIQDASKMSNLSHSSTNNGNKLPQNQESFPANNISHSQLSESVSKTQVLSNQLQGSVPPVAWPSQMAPYQNGYPMHAMYLQGTTDMVTNLKYNNAQHSSQLGQNLENAYPNLDTQTVPSLTQFSKTFTASTGQGS